MNRASEYQYTNKVWKERPPGPEQLQLEEMFGDGSITTYATPESVRSSSDIFKEFSPKIFAAHYRKTKAKMVSTAKGIPNGVIPPSPPSAKYCKIPELGAKLTLPPLKRSLVDKLDEPGEIINSPYVTWQYTDHELKTDYVCVAINIFTGSKSISFDITDDGLKIIAMFDPAKMLAKELEDQSISKQHPMLHALSSHLLQSGITENSQPEGQWIIPLPCRVRREVSSYKMSKILSGKTMTMFIRFTAYQNEAIIEQDNRTITFD